MEIYSYLFVIILQKNINFTDDALKIYEIEFTSQKLEKIQNIACVSIIYLII